MATAYPKRPPFFCMRFVRVLLRSCAAQTIGAEGGMLLMCIAQVEDSKRYSDAVTFWNDQLLPIIGLRNWAALDRARQRCVDEGWLHYEPGGKGKIGRYWVTIPERLEVLDDQPLGVNAGDIPTGSLVETNDLSVRETGNKREENGKQTGRKRGTSGEHSSLSLTYPIPSLERDAAATPTIDPDEQDITKPSKPSASVPRSEVPRGSENDMASDAMVDPICGLGTWIRWRVSDQARTDENRQTIVMLIDRYGRREIQAICEALVMRGDPARPSRPPGSKCWPDEILPAILAARSQASGSTNGANPTEVTPLPEIVAQAHALLASRGAAACRVALGWAPHVAPTDHAMRAALERLPVATELVLALSAQPALAT
jgi:hypothetical protein